MMRKLWLLTLTTTTLLWAPLSRAGICQWTVFEPQALYSEIVGELPSLGMAALPVDMGVPQLVAGRVNMLRGNTVVGQILFEKDARAGSSEASVFDVSGAVLFHVSESTFICPPDNPAGLCRKIEISTDLQHPVDGRAAYVITAGPNAFLPAYYHYAVPIDQARFRIEMGQTLAWLRETLATTHHVYVPTFTNAADKFRWALAADPYVGPYLPRLAIGTGQDGHLHIAGVVPSSGVYNRIVEISTDVVGAFQVVIDLAIDTGTQILPPVTPLPILSSCPL